MMNNEICLPKDSGSCPIRVCYHTSSYGELDPANLHDVHLLHFALVEDLARRWVSDFARINGCDVLADVDQPLLAVDAAVGQDDRVAFHVAF